jgi:hypothetical protein
VERVKGIEPSSSAWKAVALPLSYTRLSEVRKQMPEIGISLPFQTSTFLAHRPSGFWLQFSDF